ncbi:UDP-N-acetylmuramoyl-tripeptide--D-alanyl-D-alanine ligase [Conexibacter sp. DBS9H8]|uniref:UDP-N-acetylmuramoyl-tripeptide--D-alanyl-D- alanine ligase n=1 Tax=Conexibacter sp. DBS9H8 TaxID=2937801 RepID=UPI00200D49FB|nr:UDP-N-acetylmuramoyl-tripeptide--D-alanyl-D-alanine ligase [Conexibacter sp. DBS9H8]
MLSWNAERIAREAGADLLVRSEAGVGPVRVSVDSRAAGPGVLFVGLPGERTHGGRFGPVVLAAGAWGVLTTPDHASSLLGGSEPTAPGVVLSARDPLAALQRLARAWRRELGQAGARVIGVTGSTGKTSTKDLLAAVLEGKRVTYASRGNHNTEIGLPLELLAVPPDTAVVVLEMGMRGPGQIAELAAIAEPDVAVIVSIGPVHLELLGSIAAIAAAKAELIAGLGVTGTAVIPADEPLLEPHVRPELTTVRFGPGGDVFLRAEGPGVVEIALFDRELVLEVDFPQAHLRRNLLAAVAAADAVGVTPSGPVRLALSPGRGARVELPDGVTLLDDAYNANPVSMRAALDELAAAAAPERRRRVAVLGDMLELGPTEIAFHRAIGAYANGRADVIITVGPRAAAIADAFSGPIHRVADAAAAQARLHDLLGPGDVVLVKGSRGVALDQVCAALVPA